MEPKQAQVSPNPADEPTEPKTQAPIYPTISDLADVHWLCFPDTKNVQHARFPRSYKHVTSHYDVKRCKFILNNNILLHNHLAHWCTCPTLAISFTTTHTQPIPLPQHQSFSTTVTQHTSDTKLDAVISLWPSGPTVPLLRWLKQRLKCHQSHNMKW